MANEVRVNDNVMGWGSVICKIFGAPQHWITSISWSEKRERGVVYGMGRHQAPRGRTTGKYTVENPKIKGPVEDVQGLLDELATRAPDGKSYGDVRFDVTVQYVEGTRTITVEIEDCRVVGISSTGDEGSDAMQDEVELQAMRIKRNGKTLYSSAAA